jgi:hypothetical protein
MNNYYIMFSFGFSFNFLTLKKTLNIVASPLASAQKNSSLKKKLIHIFQWVLISPLFALSFSSKTWWAYVIKKVS